MSILILGKVKIENLAKGHRKTIFVIPTKVGIQEIKLVIESLDPGFHRGDDFLRIRQNFTATGITAQLSGPGPADRSFTLQADSSASAGPCQVQLISGSQVISLPPSVLMVNVSQTVGAKSTALSTQPGQTQQLTPLAGQTPPRRRQNS